MPMHKTQKHKQNGTFSITSKCERVQFTLRIVKAASVLPLKTHPIFCGKNSIIITKAMRKRWLVMKSNKIPQQYWFERGTIS